MQPPDLLKQIRKLSIYLFISGALNILLIAFMVFFTLVERPPTPYCDHKPALAKQKQIRVSPTNAGLLAQYKGYTYDQLLSKLSKLGLVEDGFTERDLALGVLVAFHDFDLDRALGSFPMPTQKRYLSFEEGKEKVVVYPSLTEEQFGAILSFAKLEKWPFKAKGLFALLKKEQLKSEPSLFEAFYLTEEFQSLNALFKDRGIDRALVLQMAQEGDFGLLSAFNEKQKTLQDLSEESREKILLAYLKLGSKNSAHILLQTDFDFVAKRLSDQTVTNLIRLLDENSPLSLKFLSAVASSPRGDGVKGIAVAKYKELSGTSFEPLVSRETIVQNSPPIQKVIPFTQKPSLSKTKPAPKKQIAEAPLPKQKPLIYIVQEGDSLWKIAKRFKVSVEDLRAANQLKTDQLKLGTPLKIPGKS